MPLINCEIKLELSSSKIFVISQISRAPEVATNIANPARETT